MLLWIVSAGDIIFLPGPHVGWPNRCLSTCIMDLGSSILSSLRMVWHLVKKMHCPSQFTSTRHRLFGAPGSNLLLNCSHMMLHLLPTILVSLKMAWTSSDLAWGAMTALICKLWTLSQHEEESKLLQQCWWLLRQLWGPCNSEATSQPTYGLLSGFCTF